MPSRFKQLLLGDPLHNEEFAHQRLTNPIALAVFSSDALSSVAYATGEILIVLALAGSGALHLTWPIAVAIATLLVVVTFSYRQTIKAYPGGGGAYIVAKENLGTLPGLTAGASLLVDYVLTVAVSISAGTAAITSAWQNLRPFTVEIALVFLAILAIANLRGVKESGALFSIPTYGFVGSMLLMIAVGYYKQFLGGGLVVPSSQEVIKPVAGLTLFLVLRAFSSGCTAMTGVEAIANGTQAFRKPESENARETMLWMAGLLGTMFLGISGLAVITHMNPSESETVISQLARAIFGANLGGVGIMYYVISIATMAILVIAANTSYADFPRLSSFIASDDFMPHQFKDRGYRLVHTTGIMVLTVAAGILLVGFGGNTARLIPLYAVGVFASFTLSQAGMVVHWWRLREPGWHWSIVVNGFGAIATFVVTIIIASTKFISGAWIVLIIIPVLIALFLYVHRHYEAVGVKLALDADEKMDVNWQSYNKIHNHVIVLVKNVDRRLLRALRYARSLKADTIEGLFVDVDGTDTARVKKEWDEAGFGIRLTIIDSPYREIIQPIRNYVRNVPKPTPDDVVTVVLPEFVPRDATDYLLHDQTSFWIKSTLFMEPGVILADVPFLLGYDDRRPEPVTPEGLIEATRVCEVPESDLRVDVGDSAGAKGAGPE
jgi:amino acid transporter